jgi:hypothetical protein
MERQEEWERAEGRRRGGGGWDDERVVEREIIYDSGGRPRRRY